jgi:glycosyltransferase involved in cell wall biosynthesis
LKISFICTLFNEQSSAGNLINSLLNQAKPPDQAVFVDAGSTDKTINNLKKTLAIFEKKDLQSKETKKTQKRLFSFKIIKKKGNRAVGRNIAIENADGEIIVCTDADCQPDKNWIKNITAPFSDPKVDIVAGFYKPLCQTTFQRCLACYTCLPKSKAQQEPFLPSSRSLAFKKSCWKAVGGYPEGLDYCEDLVFVDKLKKAGFKFAFAPQAIVFWPQRKNIFEAGRQFFNYALGDGQALYFPHLKKIGLVYLRYILATIILLKYPLWACLLALIYCLWAISKNYRFVRQWRAFIYLPLIQIVADLGVMAGSVRGLLKRAYEKTNGLPFM